MFCANVIIGEPFTGNTGGNGAIITPPLIPGTQKMYDSVMGNTGKKPQILVSNESREEKI